MRLSAAGFAAGQIALQDEARMPQQRQRSGIVRMHVRIQVPQPEALEAAAQQRLQRLAHEAVPLVGAGDLVADLRRPLHRVPALEPGKARSGPAHRADRSPSRCRAPACGRPSPSTRRTPGRPPGRPAARSRSRCPARGHRSSRAGQGRPPGRRGAGAGARCGSWEDHRTCRHLRAGRRRARTAIRCHAPPREAAPASAILPP